MHLLNSCYQQITEIFFLYAEDQNNEIFDTLSGGGASAEGWGKSLGAQTTIIPTTIQIQKGNITNVKRPLMWLVHDKCYQYKECYLSMLSLFAHGSFITAVYIYTRYLPYLYYTYNTILCLTDLDQLNTTIRQLQAFNHEGDND